MIGCRIPPDAQKLGIMRDVANPNMVAPAEYQVHAMDTRCMNNNEFFFGGGVECGAGCTLMPEVYDVANVPETFALIKQAVPCL